MPLDEIRAAFEDRIAIWGGIPSVLLCADSAGASRSVSSAHTGT